MTRRAALGGTSALLAGARLGWAGANDRFRVAIFGMGGRGLDLVNSAAATEGVEIAAFADPDRLRLDRAAAALAKRVPGRTARLEQDLRRVLDDKSIDGVVITACNHWHALATVWACQAGKHVYVEKPVSHNVFECRKMIEAARKYNRMVQAGTQRRSYDAFRAAIGLLREGAIGDIYMAHALFAGVREPLPFRSPEPPPSNLLWDLWLGPARQQPYHANLVHYNWHWFWDFGAGEIGNNGVHFLDIACWGLDKGLPSRIYATGGRFAYKDQGETPNTYNATFEYPDGTQLTCGIRNLATPDPPAVVFYGTNGTMHLDTSGACKLYRGREKQPVPMAEVRNEGSLGTTKHFRNWIDAIRQNRRELLHCEIAAAEAATTHAHLANISWRLAREVRFDPAKHAVIGDPKAERLLTRDYRKPFVVPDKL